MYRITIGDKAYSSWSLRGWLLLAAFDLPFEEVLVRMYDPAFDAMQAANAPARTVPQIEWDEGGQTRRVWDTMAIAETLAERLRAEGYATAAFTAGGYVDPVFGFSRGFDQYSTRDPAEWEEAAVGRTPMARALDWMDRHRGVTGHPPSRGPLTRRPP